jgi:hypothetical protein
MRSALFIRWMMGRLAGQETILYWKSCHFPLKKMSFCWKISHFWEAHFHQKCIKIEWFLHFFFNFCLFPPPFKGYRRGLFQWDLRVKSEKKRMCVGTSSEDILKKNLKYYFTSRTRRTEKPLHLPAPASGARPAYSPEGMDLKWVAFASLPVSVLFFEACKARLQRGPRCHQSNHNYEKSPRRVEVLRGQILILLLQ